MGGARGKAHPFRGGTARVLRRRGLRWRQPHKQASQGCPRPARTDLDMEFGVRIRPGCRAQMLRVPVRPGKFILADGGDRFRGLLLYIC